MDPVTCAKNSGAQPDGQNPFRNDATLAALAFKQADRNRRIRGMLLDAAGLGPVETPYRVLHTEPGLVLHAYGNGSECSPALLIVPAPIKRWYIWDLAPDNSIVRRCLRQGMRVYLAEWVPLDKPKRAFGLNDYADRLLSVCLDVIAKDAGQTQVILAGHSLGGTLAALFSCLHPQRVRALVALEAPMHFGAAAGSFAPLVAAAPDAKEIAELFGDVPGSFLGLVSSVAAPDEFQWRRYVDLLLSAGNAKALLTHIRVERWTLDEFQLPGKFFVDIIEQLYRGDCLMQGQLCVQGRQIGPRDMTVPLLSVFDPRSTVIPPASITPFFDTAACSRKKLLTYEGDVGVAIQHVGVLVGSNAHARLWPAVFDWLADV
ncbi:MAG: alpha/beta fold hydrolase [Pseudomonadota bacterium]